jgi:diketogulonate reductase-like aldo/keto reductase
VTRREFMLLFGSISAVALWPFARASAAPAALALNPIGLGSWGTFNVGADPKGRANVLAVIRAFFAAGGNLIDSSPMYGSSNEVIGAALKQLGYPSALFSAEKVWTGGDGAAQIEDTRRRWGLARFDLIQVHNLTDWETKLPLLFEMKAAGQLRFVGITTSHGRRHDELERIVRTQPIDFVQLTYNLRDREPEQRLLPLAQERGIRVIANRPFQRKALLDRTMRHPLPGWADDIDCASWAQVLLKFIVSHPAIALAIPATSQVAHLRENMEAARGAMPDAAFRRRMAEQVAKL